MGPRLIIAIDIDELARTGAGIVHDAARSAVANRGVFRLVLAGGDTPRALYTQLAHDPAYRDLPWDRTQVFWGDERHVPPHHPDSNYRMAHETLLSHVSIPSTNVFRMYAEETDVEQVARHYEATIRRVCALGPGDWPRFDLVLLGIGTDGHTASLFPASPALLERSHLVVPVHVDARPPVRLTMTLPAFAHAAHVAFLAAGPTKAASVAAVIQPPAGAAAPPAALVRPADGELTWMLDRAAAKFVQSQS